MWGRNALRALPSGGRALRPHRLTSSPQSLLAPLLYLSERRAPPLHRSWVMAKQPDAASSDTPQRLVWVVTAVSHPASGSLLAWQQVYWWPRSCALSLNLMEGQSNAGDNHPTLVCLPWTVWLQVYWRPGNGAAFLDLVQKLTGEPLTGVC